MNELIKEHALDSDAPKAGNSFFLKVSPTLIKCHPLVCLEDQIGHFVFARETGARGVELHYGTVCGRTWTQFPSQPFNSQKKNITAAVETRPPQLHNLLYFSPSLPSLTFCGPPPRVSQGSA